MNSKHLNYTARRIPLPFDKTYEAVIACLIKLLPQACAAETKFLKKGIMSRPDHLLDALAALGNLLDYNMSGALDAGLVELWLAKYPFGGFQTMDSKRFQFLRLVNRDYEDPYMYLIMSAVMNNDAGAGQCEKIGFTTHRRDPPSPVQTDVETSNNLQDQWFVANEDLVALPRSSSSLTQRAREESPEEEALRRRRREAMVLSEDGQQLHRPNVIEPDSTIQQTDHIPNPGNAVPTSPMSPDSNSNE